MNAKKVAGAFIGVCLVSIFAGILLAKFSLSDEAAMGMKLPPAVSESSPASALAGFVMCMSLDKCNIRRTTEEVEGREVFGFYQKFPEQGVNFKYAFQRDARALTVIIVGADIQVSVTDVDLDGVADAVIQVTDGEMRQFDLSDPNQVLDYVLAQVLYETALQVAWDKLVPLHVQKDLKDAYAVRKFPG